MADQPVRDAESVACSAWLGLEPPEYAECCLPVGHSLPHKAKIRGLENGKPDRRLEAVVCWPAQLDGAEHAD